jgi:glycosyltransferase involved in cell wall biosynthesis
MSIDEVVAPPQYTTREMEQRAPTVLQMLSRLDQGGGARVAIDLSAALVEAGGRAFIAYDTGGHIHELTRNGIVPIEMKLGNRNPITGFGTARRLARFVEENSIDVLHAQNASLATIGYAAASKAGCKLVTTFHDGPGSVRSLSKRSKAAFANSDHVVALSTLVANEINLLLAPLRGKISVVPFGVDLTRFDPMQVTAHRVVQLAKQWRVPDDLPVVMLPARFHRGKGHGLLLEALGLIRDLDLRCILVGADPDGGTYRQQLEKDIVQHELTDRVMLAEECRDMAAALMLADVVVAPYLEPATYNRVVIEAQALGRPVVATDFPNARELLDGSSMAWLTPPNDPMALGWAIRDALSLPFEEREARTEQVIQNLRSRSGRDLMCRSILDVYWHLMPAAAVAA